MVKPNLRTTIYIALMILAIFSLITYLTSIQFIISLIIILIPGFVITKLLWKTELISTIIASIGVGLVLIPIITYLLTIFLIPLNPINLSVILIIFSIILVKILYNERKKFELRINFLTLVLFFILVLGLLTRLYSIRNAYASPFTDAIVEGTIAKLIIDNQGIPSTWQPLLPIELKHQTGLASVVAWMRILSGMEIPKIILLITNLFYVLLPFAVYLLAYKLLKNQTQAVVASILTLVASLPTITFIAGMNSTIIIYFLIPISIALAIDSFNDMNKKKIFLLFLFFLGSLLIHPLFLFFFPLLFLPYIAIQKPRGIFSKKSIIIVICLLLSFLLILPRYNINPKNNLQEEWSIQNGLMNNALSATFFIDPFFIVFENPYGVWSVYADKILISHVESYFFTFAFIAILFYSLYVIIKTKNSLGHIAIAWYLLFLMFSSLQNYFQIHFPFWQFVYPTRVLFLIFLPISILLSFAFYNLKITNLKKIMSIPLPLFLFLLILISYIPVGLFQITDYLTGISKRAPINENVMKSMDWINENVPKKSVVLNFIIDVEAGVFVGDGGQWIPAMTGRIVVFPSTSVTDDVNNKEVKDRLLIMDYVNKSDTSSDKFISLLKSYNVSYIFISKLQTSSRQSFNQVSPDIFKNSHYQLVFNNSDVSIFKTNY